MDVDLAVEKPLEGSLDLHTSSKGPSISHRAQVWDAQALPHPKHRLSRLVHDDRAERSSSPKELTSEDAQEGSLFFCDVTDGFALERSTSEQEVSSAERLEWSE
jgi:hypothetical protein